MVDARIPRLQSKRLAGIGAGKDQMADDPIEMKQKKKLIKVTKNGEEPEPDFIGQIGNVTIAQGRDAILSCSVAHLNDYTVRTCTIRQWQ
jgi:hypothetical protein